jgi:hypothetical protein
MFPIGTLYLFNRPDIQEMIFNRDVRNHAGECKRSTDELIQKSVFQTMSVKDEDLVKVKCRKETVQSSIALKSWCLVFIEYPKDT